MAKILLGPTVIGIRGTVAGITFSQNGGGPYARGWHKPPNPASSKQVTARNVIARWAAAWRALTAVQQTTWNVYAAAPAQVLTDSLGQPYTASGFNWYITTQINLDHIGAAAIPTAPVLARQAIPLTPTLFFRTTASAAADRWNLTVGDPNLALKHTVWAVVVNSLGQNVAPAVYYYMGTFTPSGVRNVTFTSQLATKFGTFLVGQRLFASIYSISAEGQASPEYLAQTDCV